MNEVTVKLQSSDNEVFEVPRSVIRLSNTVNTLLQVGSHKIVGYESASLFRTWASTRTRRTAKSSPFPM